MNRDTGVIRRLDPAEPPAPAEVTITDVERKVLERYRPENRSRLLDGWRGGQLRLATTSEGPRLVDVLTPAQRKIRQAIDAFAHKKRRRHQAAVSRSRNRR